MSEWTSTEYPLPSDALRAGALRMKVKPGYVVIKRAATPETYGSGLLEIPRNYRDEPMEGEVVAVGPGRPFIAQYCCGLDPDGLYEACGMRARWRLVPEDEFHETPCPTGTSCPECDDVETFDEGERGTHHKDDDHVPRIFVCPDHLEECVGKRMRIPGADGASRAVLARPLLEERPLGVKVGDRVIFSKWAGGKQTVQVFGEGLIMTDDVLAIVEGEVGLIIRVEAA